MESKEGTKMSTQEHEGTVAPVTGRMPTDLARVARKGLVAMERFLDLMDEKEVSEERFRRHLAFGELGAKGVSYGLTAMGHGLRAQHLSLVRKRMDQQEPEEN